MGVFGLSGAVFAVIAMVAICALIATEVLYYEFQTRWGLVPHSVCIVTMLICNVTLLTAANWHNPEWTPQIGVVVCALISAFFTLLPFGDLPKQQGRASR